MKLPLSWAGPVRALLPIVAAVSIHLNTSAAPEAASSRGGTNVVPVRGIHLMMPGKKEVAPLTEFVRGTLAKEGVNTLILEFDYNFDFHSRPEFADPSAPGKIEVQEIAKACRENGIELIPQLNCLGHQSWDKRNGRLLEKHPEFDETPGKFPDNKGIYCRSYCPLHPGVYPVLFDLVDELATACGAKSVHVGMDEVFLLADPDCPRCQGKSAASLFAEEVRTLHDHLKKTGHRMWMWGDRFIDGKSTKLGKWEASENGTFSAIDSVPKDIVICDWHYENAPDTPRFFANKGFDVVACPWRKPEVALDQLAQIRAIRTGSDPAVARRGLGVVQTTWCGFSQFAKACEAHSSGTTTGKSSAAESADCFTKLFQALRDK